jgi:succinate dehydrogenase / fumarate reductase iron-sulfur subunit
MCQNVCHVIRDHDENKKAFAGPRFFLKYAELDMHPLARNEGARTAKEEGGLGMCNITKCCTEVCPEDIHITDNAIIPLKERTVDSLWDPLFKRARAKKAQEAEAAKALKSTAAAKKSSK